ncbi:hypothetical protein JNW90_24665, partial [Micromonospora sp. STR1s_5]|nr:hypothetical protein [Micromonospora sp. STR1s_5]
DGTITEYRLSPRERGIIDVPRIEVQVPDTADAGTALTLVRQALQALPHFADLGGEIDLGVEV